MSENQISISLIVQEIGQSQYHLSFISIICQFLNFKVQKFVFDFTSNPLTNFIIFIRLIRYSQLLKIQICCLAAILNFLST